MTDPNILVYTTETPTQAASETAKTVQATASAEALARIRARLDNGNE